MQLLQVALVAAVGVAAHPSGHLHMHRAFHEKRDAAQMVTATIDGKVVSWAMDGSPFKSSYKPTSAAPAPAPAATTPAAAPAAASTEAAQEPSVGDAIAGAVGAAADMATSFVAFPKCSKKKRATNAQIGYVGNTGCSGYGSNIKLVAPSVAKKYDYTIKVQGSSKDQQCKVWNKIGPKGGINGFFTGNEAKTFHLPAGQTQYLAFDQDTQGGMCCSDGSIPLTASGQFNCAWAEFDFGNDSNGKWSGFDMSTIVPSAAGGPFPGASLCTESGDICSKAFQGGGGSNAFLGGDEAKDGIGGNLPPGPVNLVFDTGFTH